MRSRTARPCPHESQRDLPTRTARGVSTRVMTTPRKLPMIGASATGQIHGTIFITAYPVALLIASLRTMYDKRRGIFLVALNGRLMMTGVVDEDRHGQGLGLAETRGRRWNAGCWGWRARIERTSRRQRTCGPVADIPR